MGEPEPNGYQTRRYATWSIVTACVLGFALLVAVVWGVALAKNDGQTPLESYIFTVVLTALSVAGGWIIAILMAQSQSFDRRSAETRQQEDLERSARSAVTRSFRIVSAMARIRTHSQGEGDHDIAELRTRMRVISEAATMSTHQALDSIEDWRRFAPAVVDQEIETAKKASIQLGKGWND